MKQLLYISVTTLLLLSCGRKSFEEQLYESAIEFTQKQCPKEIDACTTIDSMTFNMETRTLNYFYTLRDKLDEPDALSESVVEDFRENLLVKLREDLGLKKEKEANINFAYHYLSTRETGKEVLTVLYTPKEYTGKMTLHTFNYRETRNMREYSRLQCPARQDSCTVLDSIWYDSISRTLYYDYTVNGILDDDSLYDDVILKSRLKSSLVTNLNENPDIAVERDKEKINFAFRYYSATSKKKLLEQVVKNEELQKKQK